jgi:dTDP-glucose 4,6-dehydratase
VEGLLQAGANVRALVHYNSRQDIGCLRHVVEKIERPESLISGTLDVIFGDLNDVKALETNMAECKYVFHLAALIGIPYSFTTPAAYFETNVRGTLNILDAARTTRPNRVMITSTSETYGTAQFTPISERHPVNAQSPYAASKVAADQLALSYFAAYHTPVVIVRPFNTYGPRQSSRAIIPTIIKQALAIEDDSHPQKKLQLGSLDPVRDLTHVKDTARGFILASVSEHPEILGSAINLGTGVGVSIGELVERIGELMGIELDVELDEERVRPHKSEVWELVASAEKAARLLGWQPKYSLEEGLKNTIAHLRDQSKADLTAGTSYTV